MMRATAILLAVVFAGLCLACGGAGTGERSAESSAPAKKIYGREEFRKAITGKTPDEVIKAVGKPDSTQDSGGGSTWYYNKATKDPVTDKVDYSAQVVFEGGRVSQVNY